MIKNNNLPIKLRLKKLFYEYFFILAYLLILLALTSFIYLVFLGGIPIFTEIQSQLIATFSSVIPIILIFSYLDFTNKGIGKRKANLKVYFEKRTFSSSLTRNIIKFLPWQIGHISTIHGIYSKYDIYAIALTIISLIMMCLLFYMGLYRKDKRHLGDLLAGTQVQIK